jgi:hypothetical protein
VPVVSGFDFRNCLIDDLDLILCMSLNSKFEKEFESAHMLCSEAYI